MDVLDHDYRVGGFGSACHLLCDGGLGMAAGKGTFHHRLRSWTGTLTILSLPFFLYGFVCALRDRSDGITEWLTSPFGAISSLVFMTAALWYAKLEFDEVVLDYTDGGLRAFGLLANRVIALAGWVAAVYAILKMWLGA